MRNSQAAVAARQIVKDRHRSNRWFDDLSRCRPTRNRLWM